jgi:hypothetical protein
MEYIKKKRKEIKRNSFLVGWVFRLGFICFDWADIFVQHNRNPERKKKICSFISSKNNKASRQPIQNFICFHVWVELTVTTNFQLNLQNNFIRKFWVVQTTKSIKKQPTRNEQGYRANIAASISISNFRLILGFKTKTNLRTKTRQNPSFNPSFSSSFYIILLIRVSFRICKLLWFKLHLM